MRKLAFFNLFCSLFIGLFSLNLYAHSCVEQENTLSDNSKRSYKSVLYTSKPSFDKDLAFTCGGSGACKAPDLVYMPDTHIFKGRQVGAAKVYRCTSGLVGAWESPINVEACNSDHGDLREIDVANVGSLKLFYSRVKNVYCYGDGGNVQPRVVEDTVKPVAKGCGPVKCNIPTVNKAELLEIGGENCYVCDAGAYGCKYDTVVGVGAKSYFCADIPRTAIDEWKEISDICPSSLKSTDLVQVTALNNGNIVYKYTQRGPGFSYMNKFCIKGKSQDPVIEPEEEKIVKQCVDDRTTLEGKACCSVPKSVADWNGKNCVCKNPNSTFDINKKQCISKGGVIDPVITPVTDNNCSYEDIKWLTGILANTEYSSEIKALAQEILDYCNGKDFKSSEYYLKKARLEALIAKFEKDKQDALDAAADQKKREIESRALALSKQIKSISTNLDAMKDGLDLTVWRNSEGKFNTSRLVSDSVAGVVLGTAGGLITSSVIKKNQIKNGFEDLQCTIGGQTVADWDDEFTVGIR